MSLDFLLTSLIVVVIPGTGVIYTVSVALSRGRRSGVIAAVGCTLGIVPHLIAAVFGLSAFLHAGALAFRILKYAGVAYLLFLAYTMLRSKGSPETRGRAERKDQAAGAVITRGILLNLLNPKLTLFFFAFLPQFLSTDASLALLVGLGAVFMAMTFAVFAVYAALAARAGTAFASSTRIRRRIEQSMGLLLAGFAVRLALTEE
jgi:threonine/homoserine/homoserine lactone efflux protein